jgi:hypothetical protein
MQFGAMPSEPIAERDNVSAHVDCWIQAKDPEQAEARGRHWIAKEGWVVVGVKQWRPVDVDAETTGPDAAHILEMRRRLIVHRWSPAYEARRLRSLGMDPRDLRDHVAPVTGGNHGTGAAAARPTRGARSSRTAADRRR